MKLPSGERALIDERKLVDYCLSETHDDGKHKARLFRELVGISVDDAPFLLEALQHAAVSEQANLGKQDRYGQRYVIDFELHGPQGDATVRSVWIVLAAESFPRFVSCYIL